MIETPKLDAYDCVTHYCSLNGILPIDTLEFLSEPLYYEEHFRTYLRKIQGTKRLVLFLGGSKKAFRTDGNWDHVVQKYITMARSHGILCFSGAHLYEQLQHCESGHATSDVFHFINSDVNKELWL